MSGVERCFFSLGYEGPCPLLCMAFVVKVGMYVVAKNFQISFFSVGDSKGFS